MVSATTDTDTTTHTLSRHDALPISAARASRNPRDEGHDRRARARRGRTGRSARRATRRARRAWARGGQCRGRCGAEARRSEEHTSELQSLMRISYAVFCLKKKKIIEKTKQRTITIKYAEPKTIRD